MSKDEPQFGVSPVELAHSNQTSNTDLREQILKHCHVVGQDSDSNDDLWQFSLGELAQIMQLIEVDKAAAVQAKFEQLKLNRDVMSDLPNRDRVTEEFISGQLQGGKSDE